MEAPPEVRYVRSGDVFIAYQVLGDGPLDLVYVAEFWNSIEAQWEEPSFAHFLRRLASLGRLICFDQRGSGLSDPVALNQLPTLEEWMDDVRAVMRAVGSRRAALVASGGGGLMAIPFAATYPDEIHALVLLNAFARLAQAPDTPWGTTSEFEDRFLREVPTGWGRGVLMDLVAPSMSEDPRFRDWWGKYQRLGSSPGTQLAVRKMLSEADVRQVLPSIRVPTLIVHRTDNRLVNVEHVRYIASHIAGAKLVEVPGIDYFLWLEGADSVLESIEEFLTDSSEDVDHDRMLATVLFTDIAGSTEKLAELGDRAWRDLLVAFHAAVRFELTRFRGREIDTAGDGFLATFDGPARAVRCAMAVVATLRTIGVEVRTGVHTGEVESIGAKVSGLAVHIGARVASIAEPGEVLVSSTVKDLVAGSGLVFEDRGRHEMKGVPGSWQLYSAASNVGEPA